MELAEKFQDLDYPPRGSGPELASLHAHNKAMMTDFDVPTEESLVDDVFSMMTRCGSDTLAGSTQKFRAMMHQGRVFKDPLRWHHLDDKVSKIIRDDINRDSSPGLPMMQFAITNKDLIDSHSDLLRQVVIERLRRLCDEVIDPVFLDYPSGQLIEKGWLDPCRVFIKNEPHKRKKLVENRYRLIWSISVIDQIIDRLIFSQFTDAEIAEHDYLFQKGGAGLSTDEQQKHLFENMTEMLGNDFVTDDMKNWDWSFKDWQYTLYWIKCMVNLGWDRDEIKNWLKACRGITGKYTSPLTGQEYWFRHMPFWPRVMWIRLRFMARVPISLSNGRIMSHGKPCIMKSGAFITLSANSFARSHLSMKIFGMDTENGTIGDDCAERAIDIDGKMCHEEHIEEMYAIYGFIATDIEHVTDPRKQGFEFCSHRLFPDRAVPLNEAKIVFKHLNSTLRCKREQQLQLENDLRHAVHRDILLDYLRPRWEAWINEDEKSKRNSKEDQESGASSCSSSKRCKED